MKKFLIACILTLSGPFLGGWFWNSSPVPQKTAIPNVQIMKADYWVKKIGASTYVLYVTGKIANTGDADALDVIIKANEYSGELHGNPTSQNLWTRQDVIQQGGGQAKLNVLPKGHKEEFTFSVATMITVLESIAKVPKDTSRLLKVNYRNPTGSQLCCPADRMRDLLAKKANPNIPCDNGDMPLVFWALGSTLDDLKVLLKHGANVNGQSRDGTTALIKVMWEPGEDDALDKAKLLLNSGADPNIQDNKGETAIMRLAGNSVTKGGEARQLAVLTLLLDKKADVYIKCKEGANKGKAFVDMVRECKELAQHWAPEEPLRKYHDAVLKLLKKRGINL